MLCFTRLYARKQHLFLRRCLINPACTFASTYRSTHTLLRLLNSDQSHDDEAMMLEFDNELILDAFQAPDFLAAVTAVLVYDMSSAFPAAWRKQLAAVVKELLQALYLSHSKVRVVDGAAPAPGPGKQCVPMCEATRWREVLEGGDCLMPYWQPQQQQQRLGSWT